jgi:hypothetical protein
LVAHATKLVVNLTNDEVLIVGVFRHSSFEGAKSLNLLHALFVVDDGCDTFFLVIANVEGFGN